MADSHALPAPRRGFAASRRAISTLIFHFHIAISPPLAIADCFSLIMMPLIIFEADIKFSLRSRRHCIDDYFAIELPL